MRRIGQVAVALVLPAVLAAEAASAQVAGIPVYYNPRGGTGVSAAANLGFQSAGTGGLEGKAWALTGGFGAGPAYFTATVGQFNPDAAGDNEATYGGTASFKVFGGGLLPVSIAAQAGVGVIKFGSRTFGTTTIPSQTLTSIPVGVGIGLNVPLFPLKPWVAPRVSFNRTSDVIQVGGGTASESESRFGVSAGADFSLLFGLGVHAAVDYQPKKGSNPATTVIGVGAHFNFRVPMM